MERLRPKGERKLVDNNVAGYRDSIPAIEVINAIPNTNPNLVLSTRNEISDILHGSDHHRLLVVIGPCSIHDVDQAMEYAGRLYRKGTSLSDDLLVVMRTYFQKPRTTIGWPGLVHRPNIEGEASDEGYFLSRQLLADINGLDLPCATEFTDNDFPQYVDDLVSWVAIGARSVESSELRKVASGLSTPVGFKNSTEGVIKVAVDAMVTAAHPHTYPGYDKEGRKKWIDSTGNFDTHIVLRGGNNGTNYDEGFVKDALKEIDERKLDGERLLEECSRPVMIDSSHGNSGKKFENQGIVIRNVLEQIRNGQDRILGIMVESNLMEGSQPIIPGVQLKYGISITDECIGWEETEKILEECARNISQRIYVVA